MHVDKITPICPHCDFEFGADEMLNAGVDLYALAPNEEEADIICPYCDQNFVVKGGYIPTYTTAFSHEEIEYS